MTISTLSMIPTDRPSLSRLRCTAVAVLAALAGACSEPESARAAGTQAAEPIVPSEPLLGHTGVPAPQSPSDEPPAVKSAVISMVDMSEKFKKVGEVGCYLTFAYRGFQSETLIWDGEPCSAITASFVDQAMLQRQDDWDRLDSSQQANVNNLPDGKVLYVGGEFAAAIYPIGYTGATEEIWVSD